MLAVPSLLLAIGIAALLGRSLTSVMIAIGVVNVPVFARLLRGAMLSQRESDYALAAARSACKRWRIVLQHVFPNSPRARHRAGHAGARDGHHRRGRAWPSSASGSPDPSIPEWGRMLAETNAFLASEPLLALWPGLAIVHLGARLLPARRGAARGARPEAPAMKGRGMRNSR